MTVDCTSFYLRVFSIAVLYTWKAYGLWVSIVVIACFNVMPSRYYLLLQFCRKANVSYTQYPLLLLLLSARLFCCSRYLLFICVSCVFRCQCFVCPCNICRSLPMYMCRVAVVHTSNAMFRLLLHFAQPRIVSFALKLIAHGRITWTRIVNTIENKFNLGNTKKALQNICCDLKWSDRIAVEKFGRFSKFSFECATNIDKKI